VVGGEVEIWNVQPNRIAAPRDRGVKFNRSPIRRVPADLLGGLEKDEPARGFIIGQDREIAEKSSRPPLAIKSIARAGAKKK